MPSTSMALFESDAKSVGGCEGRGVQESNGLLVVEAVVAVVKLVSKRGKKTSSQQRCTQNDCGPTPWSQATRGMHQRVHTGFVLWFYAWKVKNTHATRMVSSVCCRQQAQGV